MATEQPAPAPTPEPAAPVTAVDQAVMEGNQSAFRDARLAERTGKPRPPVEAKTPDPVVDTPETLAAPAQPERTLSKRQQDANDRMRDAVQRATEDLRAENARLRSQLAPSAPRSDPQRQAPAPDPKTDYKRFLTMPDAPKLDTFESVEEHAAAMALFISDKRYEERQTATHAESAKARTSDALRQRDEGFRQRVADIEKTDPAFMASLSADVAALRPFDALIEGERATAQTAIAEEILRSSQGLQLAKHLSAHPDDLRRLSSCGPDSLFIELGKLYAKLDQPTQAPPTKTLSSTPEPPTTLGRKAVEPANEIDAAVASGDMATFRAARLRERTAGLR